MRRLPPSGATARDRDFAINQLIEGRGGLVGQLTVSGPTTVIESDLINENAVAGLTPKTVLAAIGMAFGVYAVLTKGRLTVHHALFVLPDLTYYYEIIGGPMRRLPPKGATERDRDFAINQLIEGRGGLSGEITLTVDDTTTTITSPLINENAVPKFTAKTANAAAEFAAGGMYAVVAAGSCTITHANNSLDDRTFYYDIRGGLMDTHVETQPASRERQAPVRLAHIPPEGLPAVWKSIEHLIPSVIERSRGRHTLTSLVEAMASGSVRLIVAHDDDGVLGAMGVKLGEAPSGLKVASISFAVGRDSHRWIHLIDDVEQGLREAGFKKIDIWARKGWEKKLPGYKLTHVLLEKDL